MPKRNRPTTATRVRPQTAVSRNRPLPYYLTADDTRFDTGECIGLVEIDWDAGTEYYSFTGIRSPSAFYTDLVTNISSITREVSLFGGAFSIGSASVTFANRDRYFSIKWATVGVRGRKIRIKYVNLDLGLSSALTLFSGRIANYELSGGEFKIEARDSHFDEIFESKIGRTIPLITPIRFPALPNGQAPVLAPLVYGRVANLNVGTTSFGAALPAFLVDTAASPTPFIYVVCARPLGADPAFAVTEQWKYRVYDSTGSMTTKTYSSNSYGVWARSTDPRDAARVDEMELTFYANGVTEDDLVTSTPILNPVRILEYILDTYTHLGSSDFDTVLQTAAKALAASQGYADDFATVTSPESYLPACLGGALTDKEWSWKDVIEYLCGSYAIQFYATRDGLLATYVDTDGVVSSADFSVDDETDILRDSLRIRNNHEVATEIEVDWGHRWVFGTRGDPEVGTQFERSFHYNIPGEYANASPSVHNIRRDIHLFNVRKGIRAAEIARVYAEYYKSGAQWIDFELPIRWYRMVELNRHASITHWQGTSASGGYSAVTARITKVTTDVGPRSAKIGITCFRKAPVTIAEDGFTSLSAAWTASTSASSWAVAADTAPEYTGNYVLRTPIAFGAALTTRGILTRTSESFGADQLAISTWKHSSGANATASGVFVRGSGTYNSFTGYAAIVRSGAQTLELRKFVAQDIGAAGPAISGTLLASVAARGGSSSKFERGDQLELRVEGTSLEVWVYSQKGERTGMVIGPVTDSSISSGSPGFIFVNEDGAAVANDERWREFHANDY